MEIGGGEVLSGRVIIPLRVSVSRTVTRWTAPGSKLTSARGTACSVTSDAASLTGPAGGVPGVAYGPVTSAARQTGSRRFVAVSGMTRRLRLCGVRHGHSALWPCPPGEGHKEAMVHRRPPPARAGPAAAPLPLMACGMEFNHMRHTVCWYGWSGARGTTTPADHGRTTDHRTMVRTERRSRLGCDVGV